MYTQTHTQTRTHAADGSINWYDNLEKILSYKMSIQPKNIHMKYSCIHTIGDIYILYI